MLRLIGLALVVSFSALAADSVTVYVEKQGFEVRLLGPLKLSSMYTAKQIDGFCRRRFSDEWGHAGFRFAEAAGPTESTVSAYFGREILFKTVDQILLSPLDGAKLGNFYLFQGRANGYSYGWHYALQKDAPHLTELYVFFSTESEVDAYCARPLP